MDDLNSAGPCPWLGQALAPEQQEERSKANFNHESRGAWVKIDTDHILTVIGVSWFTRYALIVYSYHLALVTVWNDAWSAI